MLFSNVYNIDFWSQGMKNIFYDTSFDQIFIQVVLSLERFPSLCQEVISLWSLKNLSNLKNESFKHTQHPFLSLKYLQNHFLRNFVWANFDLNSFERFGSLFHKMVSTSSLKNLQKIKKRPFGNTDNIRFWAKGSFKTIF